MAEVRRIMISIPNTLLKEVDCIISIGKSSRSQFVREALRLYIEERKREAVRDMMRKGYQEMATINLTLAEEGLLADLDVDMGAFEMMPGLLTESE